MARSSVVDHVFDIGCVLKEERKCLTMQSWLFIQTYCKGLFRNERGNLLLSLQELLFLISSKVSFYMHHTTHRIIHTKDFLLHQLWSISWNKQLSESTMRDWSNNPSHHKRTLCHSALMESCSGHSSVAECLLENWFVIRLTVMQ